SRDTPPPRRRRGRGPGARHSPPRHAPSCPDQGGSLTPRCPPMPPSAARSRGGCLPPPRGPPDPPPPLPFHPPGTSVPARACGLPGRAVAVTVRSVAEHVPEGGRAGRPAFAGHLVGPGVDLAQLPGRRARRELLLELPPDPHHRRAEGGV